MIENIDELKIAAATHKSIEDLLDSIDDATGEFWDDRSPNWLTKSKIEDVIEQLKRQLIDLGAKKIKIHGPCGGSDHSARASNFDRSGGHWCVSVYGTTPSQVRPIKDDTGVFEAFGILYTTSLDDCLMFQETTRSSGPFRPGKATAEHLVLTHLAWPVDSASKLGDLAALSSELHVAAEMSRDKRRRSAIREKILIAQIALERLIVPETALEQVAKRLANTSVSRLQQL